MHFTDDTLGCSAFNVTLGNSQHADTEKKGNGGILCQKGRKKRKYAQQRYTSNCLYYGYFTSCRIKCMLLSINIEYTFYNN